MSEAAARLPRMTVDEFIAWSQDQSERYELYDGEVVQMQSERAVHVLVKTGVLLAMRNSLAKARVSCTAFGDGITVKVEARTAFEPDCTVHCGPFDPNSVFAANPVIVVEVLSRSSQTLDAVTKLGAYFRVPSIQHYLIVDADRRVVVHHRRNGDEIATRILSSDAAPVRLEPPGIAVQIGDFFADLRPLDDA